MTEQSIWGRVIAKYEMAGKIEIAGVGVFSIPRYLYPKIKLGYYYNLTLEYSPFLNCIAIMRVEKVFYFKSITALAVDLFRNRNIPLFN